MKKILQLVLFVFIAANVCAQDFYEGFESGINGSQFTTNKVIGNLAWKTNKGNSGGPIFPHTGDKSASFYKANYSTYQTELISPSLDLGTGTFTLSFYHVQKEWAGDQNTLGVYVSVDGGSNWTEVVNFTSNVSDWTYRSYELNAYATLTSNTKIKFVGTTAYGYAIGLDEVTVGSGCSAPTDVTVDFATGDAAQISWTGSADSYNLEYGSNGFSVGQGTRISGISGNSHYISGLSNLTTYDVYVQSDCGSAWAGGDSIETGVNSFPYFEDFDVAENWVTGGDFYWFLQNTTEVNGGSGWAAIAEFFYEANNNESYLYSPVFDLRGLTNPVLNFYVAYQSYPSANDRLEIEISTDGGQTFSKGSPPYYNYSRNSNPSLATVPDGTEWFEPTSADHWRHSSLDLTEFEGDSLVMIAFVGRSSYGNNLYIDNVKIDVFEDQEAYTIGASGTVATNLGIEVNFSDEGAGGTLQIRRFDSESLSLIPTTFTNSSGATTEDGSSYVPWEIMGGVWYNVTYTGNDLTGTISYDMILDLNEFPGLSQYGDNLYIVKRSDETSSWDAQTTERIGDKLYVYGLTQFSDFGGGGGGGPLAVEMSIFTGHQSGGEVILNWTTEMETNNSHFIVERSSDGKEFSQIGKLTGAGDTHAQSKYEFIDRYPIMNGAYYRIASVETKGKIDYSKVIFVAYEGPSIGGLVLYPNPVVKTLNIRIESEHRGSVSMDIFDGAGQLALSKKGMVEAGYTELQIDVSELNAGIYLLSLVSSGGERESKSFRIAH